ncbi:MAG: nitroreductase family protein [Oscillospiraceae bacterium]|jgi:nitroreductase|nr:nitroreductase family protein [Oscillospiraceae bacterium]
MTVEQAIKERRSVRSYLPKTVEEEKLLAVLEAGRLSPSAKNQQQWKFILVRDPEKLKLLLEASEGQRSVEEAPAAIVACASADYTMLCGERTAPIDTSIAFSSMLLRAYELGLGTCWLGRFRADIVKSALGIPDNVEVVAVTPIGYPAETPEARPRKTLAEVASFDKYE